jgi:protein-disulfide isomerase
MFTMIDEWCPWCLVTHILNLLIFVCVLLMWPRVKEARAGATGTSRSKSTAATRGGRYALGAAGRSRHAHPSGRLVLITLTAVVLLAFGQNEMLGKALLAGKAANAKRGFDQCLAAVQRIQADVNKLVLNWRLADKQEFELGPDDPRRTGASPGEQTVQVVLFSDFQCPSCKRLAAFIEDQAQPLFEGHLTVVFRHYPLCADCNSHVKKTLHQHACFTATVAEAAHILGGNDGFWQAHEYLFMHQNQLNRGTLTPETIASELGFEAEAFGEAMRSEEVAKRIAEDVDLAQRCDVASTPALFVSGRRVDQLARMEPAFWDQLADIYWKSRDGGRPESTKLGKAGSTRDNRDQPGAP